MAKTDLTAQRLRELLYYDPETGAFTWRSPRKGVNIHKPAGCFPKGTYACMRVDKRTYRIHRLVWLYVHGTWPADQIDHINGIKHDNRIENLRESMDASNRQNIRVPQSNNKSGFLGVRKQGAKWAAAVTIDRRPIHLGMFNTPEEAHQAYIARKRILHPFNTL